MGLLQFVRDITTFAKLPSVSINLMHSATAENDPFYGRIVREFFDNTQKRHRKFPLVRQYEYGVAVCVLPKTFEEYLKLIEPAARRNYKKAARSGYSFGRIEFNDFLADVQAIHSSADVRQGKEFAHKRVTPAETAPSRNPLHDYPYFGVLREGKLVAYAGCLISGELCAIESILGHAAYLQDGIVPMLIMGTAERLLEHYKQVKYYMYGTFFGARPSMRRFKTKFAFKPHHVTWVLG